MSASSTIEWTDATWNPIRGCTKISPGCAHCYAEAFAERFRGVPGHPYEQGFDLRLWPERLNHPLRWKRPRMIFVNSMSDLFHEDVPLDYIRRVFDVMGKASHHTFQVLTKRPPRRDRTAARLASEYLDGCLDRKPALRSSSRPSPGDRSCGPVHLGGAAPRPPRTT